ncbi:MAG: AMP-binding protein [Deltaproteobacteria bacterium]|nr:AMP-binding protein [Deltaproteobacteria bacterium]
MNPLENGIFDLASIAHDVALNDPARIAVVEPAGRGPSGVRRYRRYTYRELSADVEAVAPGLREIGIAEGTRTVFMSPPSYETCVIGLALSRVGATLVLIDPSVGYRNVAERLRRIEPEAFVGIPVAHLGRLAFGWGPRTLRKLVVTGTPGFPGAHTVQSLRRKAPDTPVPPAISPDDPAAIMYTTGSTGPAKPSYYQHRHFAAVCRQVHQSWRFDPKREIPVDMPVFPAFFFIALSAGGTVVVPPIDFVRQGPAKANPAALVEVINDCGVRSLFGSPVLLENLATHAVRNGLRMPTLKRVIGGGAPIVASLVKPMLDVMGEGGDVVSNYGSTEALPSTEMSGREMLKETWKETGQGAGICVGRPFDGTDLMIIRIVDGPLESMDAAEILGPGETGEILIRGAHVSPAYFRDLDSTRKNKIPDGQGGVWHRIGDAGYLDAQGRLWYCGRAGQRVKAAGGPLFSLQCEPIFDTHPKVRRSGLVGVAVNGQEIPVICVELKAGFHRDELPEIRKELLDLAARHPVTRPIRQVLFKRRLPVDPRHNSKIERPALALWAASQISRAAAPGLASAA